MTAIMMFAYAAVPTFAADTGSITIKGVEDGATVTAYKIVQPAANGDWEAVKNNSIQNVKTPTADEIAALAADTSGLTAISVPKEAAGANYVKGDLGPGMYLVLVSKTDGKYVYNPMIVSVNYDDLDGEVDANSSFTIGSNTAYAKRSEPKLDKKITGKPANGNVTGDTTEQGDTLKVDDDVTFEITTTIPSYSKAYDNNKLKFEISDTLSVGLDPASNIVVKDAAGTLTEGAGGDYTLEQSGNTFTIKFTRAYLLSGNAAKSITVTYKSKLNENATSGFDANTNEAAITYSNTPNTTQDKDKTTYHYTFDIDGNVFGNMKGREIVKVGVDQTSGDLITTTTESTITNALEGAEFALLDSNGNQIGNTVKSDGNGLITFKGLDAGNYFLQEKQAPTGYKTDSTKIPVKIEATLNPDGTLASYKVTINGTNATTYTWNNAGPTATVDKTGDTSLFNNYKAGNLPSTGGSGIYFYIIVGALLIMAAGGVYIYSRRKQKA